MNEGYINDRHQYFSYYRSVCAKCKHFNETEFSCPAFDEIPLNILSGESDHSKPLPDQNNKIVFSKKITLEDIKATDNSIPIKSEGLQKLYLDLASGKRQPKTDKEREMLKEIRAIEERGGMIDFELD